MRHLVNSVTDKNNLVPFHLHWKDEYAIIDLKAILEKNWHISQIEPKLKEIFAEPLILAFERNKNLKGIIGGVVKRFLITKKFWTQRNLAKGNANHVLRDQLTYIVNNSKLSKPFFLIKTPF